VNEALIFLGVAGAGLVGFTIAGVAGFGGGVIMLPILVWVLGVREAVPALTLPNSSAAWVEYGFTAVRYLGGW